MKNAFYFVALFVLQRFNFGPDFFDHVAKRLDKKAKVDFKISDINFSVIQAHFQPLLFTKPENTVFLKKNYLTQF